MGDVCQCLFYTDVISSVNIYLMRVWYHTSPYFYIRHIICRTQYSLITICFYIHSRHILLYLNLPILAMRCNSCMVASTYTSLSLSDPVGIRSCPIIYSKIKKSKHRASVLWQWRRGHNSRYGVGYRVLVWWMPSVSHKCVT